MNQHYENDSNVAFMNHGYYPINKKVADVFLDTCASMYCFILDKFENSEKENILDIGCGRGGGTNIIKHHYGFKKVYGCDYNKANINFCNSTFAGIDFREDDAEFLREYPDNFFNCVINVESSHCYENKRKFYYSVRRVLKDEGIFLYADIFEPEPKVEKIINQFFTIKERIDITNNVMLSCEYTSDKLMQYMKMNKTNKYEAIHNVYASHLKFYKTNSDKFYVYILKKREIK